MAEKELNAEIVRSGEWLYDGAVPSEVWIVRQNFEFWFDEGFSDEPEQLNEDGELFQVVFARNGKMMSLGPDELSLGGAVASAEAVLNGKIDWTNHRNQNLFGGRRYSIVPVD